MLSVRPRVSCALLVALLASGCATLSPEQCATMDWYSLGLRDGRAGHDIGRIDLHREACAEVGIRPDRQAWVAGREAGLNEYCRLSNAIELGLSRSSYGGVCRDPDFLPLYRAAHRVGEAEAEIERIDREIERAERKLREASKDNDDKATRRHRDALRDLDRDRRRAREDRDDAEYRLERARRDHRL